MAHGNFELMTNMETHNLTGEQKGGCVDISTFFSFAVLKNKVRQCTGEIKEIIQGRNTMTIINKIMKDRDNF